MIITDALPTSSAAVELDVITPHYKEQDVREDHAEPTPRLSRGQARRHFRLLYGVPLRRDPMRRGMYSLIKETPAEGLGAETRLGQGIVKR